MHNTGILVVGSANMDMVVVADRFPRPGETILGTQFNMFPGGKGANQAVCSAKLGGATYFIGKMGRDIFKDRLKVNMEQSGVALEGMVLDSERSTGIAMITINNKGENEIIVISGANMQLGPEDINSQISLFSKVSVVITQLEIPLETVFKTAQLANSHQKVFILNPAPAQMLPNNLLDLVDFLTPNENELELLSGMKVTDVPSAEKAAKRLIEDGIKNVIVTLGDQGALLVNRDRAKLFPTSEVEVVDTTAAGDAFNGAFAFALANNEDVEHAITFANRVASYSVTRMGAQVSMPTNEEIMEIS